MAEAEAPRRFLPGRHGIEAYGAGGFRFGEMSHRGSILCLPSGVHAWPVADGDVLAAEHFALVVAEAAEIELLLVGTGRDLRPLPRALVASLREAGIRLDLMPTPPAARTYNVLVAEGRKVAAALVAVP